LAPPEIGVRIVLHGKAGVGSMPPLGPVLNDEQIAAALTLVRREWDNDAGAVAPALVASVRAGTASRTRPWTTAELTALAPTR
jgi:mono/diheme cytochrome c family protein